MTKTKILVTLLIAGFALRSEAQAPSPQGAAANITPVNVVLADGTAVKLRLGSAFTGVRVGESLELEVAENVRVSDVVVIPKGSVGNAQVTNLRSGANARGGWIDINLESVTLADGQRVPIRA
jgi:hypothetical protein